MANADEKALTRQQKDLVSDWLNPRWLTKKCPVCSHNNWVIADHLVHGLTYSGGGVTIGGPLYPLVLLICQNCAHTLVFNAVVMGLVPAGKEG